MGYQITWSKKAERSLRRLDRQLQRRVADTVDGLAGNPRPHGAIPVRGIRGVLRVRQEDYRILYTVNDDERTIWIEDVRPRDKAYRAR